MSTVRCLDMSGFPVCSCLGFFFSCLFFFFLDNCHFWQISIGSSCEGRGGQDWRMEVIDGVGAGLWGHGVTLLLKGESNTLSEWLFWVPAWPCIQSKESEMQRTCRRKIEKTTCKRRCCRGQRLSWRPQGAGGETAFSVLFPLAAVRSGEDPSPF